VTVSRLVENLPAHIVYSASGWQSLDLHTVIASDLMSDVLVSVDSDALLVTSLATEQTVRSADMVGAPVILLVNDKLPSQAMKTLAEQCGITVLATPMPMYEACVTLGILQQSDE
jgi:hypothetical protein